jgi:hypothetical protein
MAIHRKINSNIHSIEDVVPTPIGSFEQPKFIELIPRKEKNNGKPYLMLIIKSTSDSSFINVIIIAGINSVGITKFLNNIKVIREKRIHTFLFLHPTPFCSYKLIMPKLFPFSLTFC